MLSGSGQPSINFTIDNDSKEAIVQSFDSSKPVEDKFGRSQQLPREMDASEQSHMVEKNLFVRLSQQRRDKAQEEGTKERSPDRLQQLHRETRQTAMVSESKSMTADSSPHLKSIKQRQNNKRLPSQKLRLEVEAAKTLNKPLTRLDMERDGRVDIRFGKKKKRLNHRRIVE